MVRPQKDIKRADFEVLVDWFEELAVQQVTGKEGKAKPYYTYKELRREILRRLCDYSVFRESQLKGEY